MGRIRSGSIVMRGGNLYAVVQFVDESGRKRGIITLRVFNTKMMRERQVAMTARLKDELERL